MGHLGLMGRMGPQQSEINHRSLWSQKSHLSQMSHYQRAAHRSRIRSPECRSRPPLKKESGGLSITDRFGRRGRICRRSRILQRRRFHRRTDSPPLTQFTSRPLVASSVTFFCGAPGGRPLPLGDDERGGARPSRTRTAARRGNGEGRGQAPEPPKRR